MTPIVYYDKPHQVNAADYGIEIPIVGSRPDMIHDSVIQNCPKIEIVSETRIDTPRPPLELVHSAEFVHNLLDSKETAIKELMKCYELINDDGSFNRYNPANAIADPTEALGKMFRQCEGTYIAAKMAWDKKNISPAQMVYYLGGGQHHARIDGPSGFCLLNDIALTAMRLIKEDGAGLIWIIDVDVHKGDGTAEIVNASVRGELPVQTYIGKNPEIINLSIHMARGWPLDREELAKSNGQNCAPIAPSRIDIGIESGDEANYVPKLKAGMDTILGYSGNRKPDFAIVVDGADPYEKDGLPSSALLKLSLEQCIERDMAIYHFLQAHKVPSVWLTSGGYGNAAWEVAAAFLKKLNDEV
ncbi:MAG: hypothetical protein LBM77_04950 [Spirochaetaceae bacterium]|jgi:acetoin utilization deacetylase AcuC-like enzyme|nr:hypothetical protein [Spirochaetaceae bacterium]